MSFILDALRKADAQRERDPSRGIHAQPLHATSAGPSPLRADRRLWWAAIAISVVGIVAAAWSLMTPAPAMVDIAPPASPQILPDAAPRPAAEPVPAIPTAAVPAPAPGPAAAIEPPAPPPAPPAPTSIERRGSIRSMPLGDPPLPAPALAASTPAPAPTPAPALAPAAPPAAMAAPQALGNLPKMTITGGVYSANPALRMLIVNGQVFNEGAEPVPGVVLEQIRSSTAVLLYRGARYTVPF